jgi:tellurium resistance protein TerD
MALVLTKGDNVSLSKEAPGLKAIYVALGWDVRATSGADFDLDAAAFILNKDGKVRGDQDFVFYNQKKSGDGSVEHLGDNRTGVGEGDDEIIKIDLANVPEEARRISFSVTIHNAGQRRQNFGQISNAFIRVVNQENDQEIARFNLTEDMAAWSSMIFGEIYRRNEDWEFKAIGQGIKGGLSFLARNFGIEIKSE